MSDWRGPSALAGMLVPIDTLEPFPSNPRIGDVTAVAASLERFGQLKPVVVDGTRIVAGHHVVQAARERLGWTEIAVAHNDFGAETEQRAFLLADNRTSELGSYDESLLAEHLQALAELDGLAGTGFDGDDLDDLLADLRRLEVPIRDPDDAPEPPAKPKSKLGEVYELGPHRLMCGDAFDAGARDDLVGTSKIDALLTDPPYGISLDTDFNKPQGKVSGRTYRPVHGDDDVFDATEVASWAREVKEQFWFGANYYRRTLSPTDRDGSWLVWDKRTEETDVVVGSGFELIWSRIPHKQEVLRFMWTNYTSQYNAGLHREHPTEKPVALLATIIKRWIPAAASVADLFAGSGTTLIACEDLGRRCFAMELDPGYCDVIRKRYADFTGQPEFAP